MAKASNLKLLWVLLGIGLLGVLAVLPHRIAMERASHSVEVVLDYDSYSEYFHAQGLAEDDGFKTMKEKGATAVAFNENYLVPLQQSGRLKLYSGVDMAHARRLEDLPAGPIVVGDVYLVVYDDSTFDDVRQNLTVFLRDPKVPEKVSEWGLHPNPHATHQTPRVLQVVSSEKLLGGLGFGFSTELITHFRHDLGFHVVLRPENKAGVDKPMVADYLKIMPLQPNDTLVFGGARNEALGYVEGDNALLDDMVSAVETRHLRLGEVEVATPKNAFKGEEYLLQHDIADAVRVQTIAPGQLAKMIPSDALDMFQLGVRERNVRMIYLRPFADAAPPEPPGTPPLSLADTNEHYVGDIARMLTTNGFQSGNSSVFADGQVPIPWEMLLNLSVGAAMALLVLAFWPDTSLGLLLVLPALFVLGAMGSGLVHRGETWSKLAALAAALAMPSLAMMWVVDQIEAYKGNGHPLGRTLSWLARASAISLIGGLLVACTLACAPFMLEVDQFRGIKLLMIIPPAIVMAYAVTRRGSLRDLLVQVWNTPMTLGLAFTLLVVLAAGVFYIMRTGNTPETGASDLERTFRSALQRIFIARPRFKDFCLGHPAFMVLGFAAIRRTPLNQWALLFLIMLSTIGQADIVDTFAHIHTPYLISLLRVVNGLWLGVLVGLVLAWVLGKASKVPSSAAP